MSWPEFREFAALFPIALGSLAAIVLLFLAIVVGIGAAMGAAAGALVWAFHAVAGACQ